MPSPESFMSENEHKWQGLIAAGKEACQHHNLSLAEKYFLDAMHLAEELPGFQENLEESVNTLAVFYYAYGFYEKAEPYWDRGLSFLEMKCGPASREVGTYIYNMAEGIYRPQGKVEKADGLRKQAIEICGEGFFKKNL